MTFATTTAEVAAALRLSKNTLIRLRASDILRPAIHYISVGHGKQRACLRWDLDKVEETLARRSKSLPCLQKISLLRRGADGICS